MQLVISENKERNDRPDLTGLSVLYFSSKSSDKYDFLYKKFFLNTLLINKV